jgi:hypothetical protein
MYLQMLDRDEEVIHAEVVESHDGEVENDQRGRCRREEENEVEENVACTCSSTCHPCVPY